MAPGILTYFFLDSDSRPAALKIGVSQDVGARLRVLRNQSGRNLRILYVLIGDHETEWHLRFALYRLPGEYFRFEPEVELMLLESLGAPGSVEAIATSLTSLPLLELAESAGQDDAVRIESFLAQVEIALRRYDALQWTADYARGERLDWVSACAARLWVKRKRYIWVDGRYSKPLLRLSDGSPLQLERSSIFKAIDHLEPWIAGVQTRWVMFIERARDGGVSHG